MVGETQAYTHLRKRVNALISKQAYAQVRTHVLERSGDLNACSLPGFPKGRCRKNNPKWPPGGTGSKYGCWACCVDGYGSSRLAFSVVERSGSRNTGFCSNAYSDDADRGFQTMPITIPSDADRGFQTMPIADSERCRSRIPNDADRGFRTMAIADSDDADHRTGFR